MSKWPSSFWLCMALLSCAEANELHLAFPEKLPLVLAGDGFEQGASGYRPKVSGPLRPTLAARGEDGVRFEVGELTIVLTEDGVKGAPERDGPTLRYARRDGTTFWSATSDRLEEWLFLPRHRGGLAARWTVTGATPRQAREQVELLDARGAPRVIMRAPVAFDRAGEVPVWLRLVSEAHAHRGLQLGRRGGVVAAGAGVAATPQVNACNRRLGGAVSRSCASPSSP